MQGAGSSAWPCALRWTAYGFALLLAVLTLLPACAEKITGIPDGAAGFGPVSSLAPAELTPEEPQRRLDEIDTCALLTPVDLDRVGGADGEPQRNALLPQSCAYDLAGGAPGDVAAVAFFKPLDQVREQAPHGTLVHTVGYQTWLVCGVDHGYQSCSAAVAVHPDRTLLVLLSRRDVSKATVRSNLEALTHIALARLPGASRPGTGNR